LALIDRLAFSGSHSATLEISWFLDSGCTARSGCMIVPAGCILGTIPFAAALGLVLMAMQAAP